MPLLSVIVPVYNVEQFLTGCMDSLLADPVESVEIIAVDDASTDGSAEVLRRYARDPRVRIVTLEENRGLGGARNAALEVAQGDYVMFVDSDDWVSPGALRKITARIRETAADVVLFDFARVYADGRQARNDRQYILHRAPDGLFRLEDHPQLANLLQVVWNKAYRREFVSAVGLRFFTGYYEDIPWTNAALMSAARIAVLDEVCYVYRIGRPDSITQATSPRHFEALLQYERLFEFMDAHPETGQFWALMHARMTRHLLTILRLRRVPDELRRSYFSAVATLYRDRRPPKPTVLWARDLALRRNLYHLNEAVETARRLRNKAGRHVRRAARTARRFRSAAGAKPPRS